MIRFQFVRVHGATTLPAAGTSPMQSGSTHAGTYERLFGFFQAVICWVVGLAVAAGLTVDAAAKAGATQVEIPSTESRGLMLSAILHQPARQEPMPAIVLMHGCDGWRPAVMHALRDHAAFFVDHGFVVLNLDSFGPRGNADGRVCESDRELARARQYRKRDAFDALEYLRSQPFVDPANIFLIGQSNGGSVAMIVAATKRRASFRGAVALYPWCGAIRARESELAIPLLILGGGRDDWVPPQPCQRLETSGAELRVKIYEDAAHSFDVPVPVQRYLRKRIGFNRTAAEASRTEMTKFFRDLAKRPEAPEHEPPNYVPAPVKPGLEHVTGAPSPGDRAGELCGTGASCSAFSAAVNNQTAARQTRMSDRQRNRWR